MLRKRAQSLLVRDKEDAEEETAKKKETEDRRHTLCVLSGSQKEIKAPQGRTGKVTLEWQMSAQKVFKK